jgi:hypothetical protein
MQPTHVIAALVAAAGLCIGASAHADPVSDFTFGTTVYLRTATLDLDGNKTSTGGIALTKPANTLTFDVAAAAIGSPLPITLHLVGAPLSGNLVQYTFSWNGNVDVDGQGHMLTAANGSFVAAMTATPGDLNAIGNVAVDILPVVSYINATGDWGTKTLFVDHASFYGGYLPATLAAYGQSDNAEICSDTTAVQVPMYVRLDNPAPPTGQWVFLTSAFHQGLSLPPIVVVPPGQKSRVFNATVAPNFAGTVHTTATSGGGIATLDIEVDNHQACQSGSGGHGPPVAYNPDPGCIQCTIFRSINDYGERLGLVGRDYVFFKGTTATTLATMFAAQQPSAISANAISNSGYITGLVTIGGVTTAYRANVDLDPGSLQQLGAITPRSIGSFGTVVGSRPFGTGQARAAVNYGTGIIDVPLPSSFDVYSSTALAISDIGEVIGTYTTGAGGALHGFRFLNGHATQLPATAAVPVAINATGQVAANGVDARGLPTAAIVAADGSVTLLGSPRGFTNFQITSMNSRGIAVGTAASVGTTVVTRAFVWSRTAGFQALSSYRPELPVVDQAYQITDTNTIAVHGVTANGVANLFVLPL